MIGIFFQAIFHAFHGEAPLFVSTRYCFA
ncbi:hypothetical protein YPPY46_1205, partial [Yersinia pestis PY-46]